MKYITKTNNCSTHLRKYGNYPALFLMVFASSMLHSPVAVAGNDKDKNKDKIEIKRVLQNTFFGECHYSGEVVLDVKYKLKSQDTNSIIIEGTTDGVSYFQLFTKAIDKGNGRSSLVFEAGECLQDIRVSFES